MHPFITCVAECVSFRLRAVFAGVHHDETRNGDIVIWNVNPQLSHSKISRDEMEPKYEQPERLCVEPRVLNQLLSQQVRGLNLDLDVAAVAATSVLN